AAFRGLAQPGSVRPGAAVLDPYVRAFADAVQVCLVHGRGAAIVHADVDRVAGAVGFDPVLECVARDCATGGAGGNRDIAPALAVGVATCKLLGRNRADDAAEHRAGDVGAAIAALDRRDRAAVVAARAGRSGRGIAVARAVAGRRA